MVLNADLTQRQRDLMEAFVGAWEASAPGAAHQPFDFGGLPLEHPNWPPKVSLPSREEVRPLVHLDLLEVDQRAAPVWRVFPSAGARERFGDRGSADADALADPDRRLGLILEAANTAFSADPSEPIYLNSMEQLNYVSHEHWPLQPDVVREHDLEQLEVIGMVAIRRGDGSMAFWPTPDAREALRDVPAYLEKVADSSTSEAEESRLRGWVDRLRTGDVAVGATTGTLSGILVRVLLGG